MHEKPPREDKLAVTPEMLRDAKQFEDRHRYGTGGEATADTSNGTTQVSPEEMERYGVTGGKQLAHPDEEKREKAERARDAAIEKIREYLKEKDPKGMRPTVEYDELGDALKK